MKGQALEDGRGKAHTIPNTISTICTGGFRVEGKVDGFLLNTGASVTLLHKDTWGASSCQHGRDSALLELPLQVFGQAEVQVALGNTQFPWDFQCSY